MRERNCRNRAARGFAGLIMIGGLLLPATGVAQAAPTPTPQMPTEPLPAPLVVADDGDVLTQRGILVAPGLTEPPKIPATGWMIVDLDSGAVLAARDARAQLAPASTLKMLTALTVMHGKPDLNAVYTASPATEAVDGTRVGLEAGSQYKVNDLLHGLLMASGNDTAVALSERGGGDAKFSPVMRSVAVSLGATDTRPVNTSGLDAVGQVSSARDLALFGQATLQNPTLAQMVVTQRYAFPGPGTGFDPKRPRWEIYNHNKMLGKYPGTLGVKNGFTQAARGSFVGAANRNGRTLECVVLHAEWRVSELCTKMLDWGFSQPAPATGVTTLADSVAASAPPKPSAAPSGSATRPGAAAQAAGASAHARQPSGWVVGGVLAGFVLAGTAALALWRTGRSD